MAEFGEYWLATKRMTICLMLHCAFSLSEKTNIWASGVACMREERFPEKMRFLGAF
jgi:hypothetical protein